VPQGRKKELSYGADAWSAVFADRTAELREISRYLHDTVSQELVTLAFTLSHIESMPLPDSARAELESAQRMIDHCCREVRLIGCLLAPPPLVSDNPLPSAIEQLAQFLSEETGMRISCDLDPPPALSDDSHALLVTAVQSWLALPIRRRTEPSVHIRLRNRPREVMLDLGMSPPPAAAAEGWAVLRGRARALGGEFSVTVESERVSASLCLPQRAEA
jgi:signal transduction histidine kinase